MPLDTEAPNVFISWSGDYSRAIATSLRDWLPDVVPIARPWLSSEDIAKGSGWQGEIQRTLAQCGFGIVVLTPENLTAPWVLFESGAIYKAIESSRVCTLLCELKPPLTGPLGLFQATQLAEDDVRRLVRDTETALKGQREQSRVDKAFEKFWPDLREAATVATGLWKKTKGSIPPKASTHELVEEVLSTVRTLRLDMNRIASKRTSGRFATFAERASALSTEQAAEMKAATNSFFGTTKPVCPGCNGGILIPVNLRKMGMFPKDDFLLTLRCENCKEVINTSLFDATAPHDPNNPGVASGE